MGTVEPAPRIAHVFPYDVRHLGDSVASWTDSQFARWPLAAISTSKYAPQSSVHVIGPFRGDVAGYSIPVHAYRGLLSGPHRSEWGDDWSPELGRFVSGLRANDVLILHLHDYPVSRRLHQLATACRVVLVAHGRGTGRGDAHHRLAEGHVVLRAEGRAALVAHGVDIARVQVLAPTIDCGLFRPAPHLRQADPPVVGFVGRVEAAKGIAQLCPALEALRRTGRDFRLEIVGKFGDDGRILSDCLRAGGLADVVRFLGALGPHEVAQRMQQWSIVLLPSQSEGYPIVAVEALATGTPVAAVAGVLPAELERAPHVFIAPRERYGDAAVAAAGAKPDAEPVIRRCHFDGGIEWDHVIDVVRASPPIAERPAAERRRQFRRLRAVRRLRRAFAR